MEISTAFDNLLSAVEETRTAVILNNKFRFNIPDAETFKEWRERSGFYMSEVAERTGVSASTISRLESGSDISYFKAMALFEFYKSELILD